MPVSMSCVAIWRCADAAGCTNVACRCGMMRRLMRETRQRGRLSLPTGRPWPLILAAAPRAKASVCGKTAAEAQEKTVCVSPSCCSTASNGISLWQSGSGSARKGSVCLSLMLQHREQRHQSVAEWQRKRKKRQCVSLSLPRWFSFCSASSRCRPWQPASGGHVHS